MKNRLFLLLAGIVSIILTIPPTAASAAQHSTPLAKCEQAAIQRKISKWLCIGGILYYKSANDTRKQHVERIAQDDHTKVAVTNAPADDYDTWCESGTICHRLVNNYIEETKGNAGYGDGEGATGAFDVIIRTSLNGRQPQYRGTFIWDAGPTLDFMYTQILCLKQWAGLPLTECGSWPVDNGDGAFQIGPTDYRDSGPLIYGNRLEDSGDYFTRLSFDFQAEGTDFGYGSNLESSLYNCPGTGNCTF